MNEKYCSLSKWCEENDNETCLVWLAYQKGKEEGGELAPVKPTTQKILRMTDDGKGELVTGWFCPECGCGLPYTEDGKHPYPINYCWNCGQKLNWSDVIAQPDDGRFGD